MIRLNNKGMSLVELIITFAAFMVIMIGVYNLIIDSKETLRDKELVKNVTDYSSFRNDEIHYDLITNKPFSIVIKKSIDDNFSCMNKNCSIDKHSVSINYNNKIKKIGLGLLKKDYCKNLYPCAIYFYNNKKEIGTVTIALNASKDSKIGPGILYGKELDVKYKKLPNASDVTLNTNSKNSDSNVYLDYKKDMFIINYPYYLKDKINYGFKIVYPFE